MSHCDDELDDDLFLLSEFGYRILRVKGDKKYGIPKISFDVSNAMMD